VKATIRPAAPSEADTLTALALAGKGYWGYPAHWLKAWRPQLTFTPDYLAANIVSCAEDESGRVVGCYVLERDTGGLRLEHLWLDPAAIGGGLGRRLFEHAAKAARQLGAEALLIEADPNAEGFYLHMGARRIGQTISHVTGTERVLPLLRYVLPGA
jgi:GNAT superfamily N-acetyltransferase